MSLLIPKLEGMMPERIRGLRQLGRKQGQRDKKTAEVRALKLPTEGLSLPTIAERFLREGLYPPRGNTGISDGSSVIKGESRRLQ